MKLYNLSFLVLLAMSFSMELAVNYVFPLKNMGDEDVFCGEGKDADAEFPLDDGEKANVVVADQKSR